MNKISLIMPSKNVQGMVTEILDGISDLQWTNIYKLCIIDNGSKDNTISEIEEFIARKGLSSKIEFIKNHKDLGYGYSINLGLRKLVADPDVELIGVIHSDNQFYSNELVDLMIKHNQMSANQVLLVNRKRSISMDLGMPQLFRNFGNGFISLVGSLTMPTKLGDFNSPFFLIPKSNISQLLLEYNFGDDIFFHPRINMIFSSTLNCVFEDCNWNRASRTSKIPIVAIGLKIVLMYVRFGFFNRIRRLSIKRSYEYATNINRFERII
jgi:glycosyltransferase involved in cell wall biosynthesis